MVSAVAFWWLDGYDLRQERLFRKLYEDVIKDDDDVAVFSMNTGRYCDPKRCGDGRMRAVFLSRPLWVVYALDLGFGGVLFGVAVF